MWYLEVEYKTKNSEKTVSKLVAMPFFACYIQHKEGNSYKVTPLKIKIFNTNLHLTFNYNIKNHEWRLNQ